MLKPRVTASGVGAGPSGAIGRRSHTGRHHAAAADSRANGCVTIGGTVRVGGDLFCLHVSCPRVWRCCAGSSALLVLRVGAMSAPIER
jgi:hypothetical protein